ncbi:AMP-binding protein [Nocardia sp. NPDC057440]|uniref:AMP-binding protein n=1 Tax=Nocardia sp. NPDC057440 TaxID=3346134 RepID=UPI00366D2D7B
MNQPTRKRPVRSRRPRVINLPRLLAAAVEADPDGTAVSCRRSELSYRELDSASSRLARLLIEREIGPGDLVALAIGSSIESVSAMWAVSKTGAGFIVVDTNTAAEHVTQLLADWKPAIGLAAGAGNLRGSAQWLMLNDQDFQNELALSSADEVSHEERLRPIRAEDIAYVTFAVDAPGVVDAVAVTQAAVAGICARRGERRATSDSMTVFLSTASACGAPFTVPMTPLPWTEPIRERPVMIDVVPDRALDIRTHRLARRLVTMSANR